MMIRLFVTSALLPDAFLPLPLKQAHYLKNVLRQKEGDQLLAFNGKEGEWLCEIVRFSKNEALLKAISQTRSQTLKQGPILICAPLKASAFEWLLEKATELGVSKIIPVLTEQCDVRKINETRAQAILIEASEQSERLDVPELGVLMDLKDVLKNWDSQTPILACLERQAATPVLDAIADQVAFLVGPAGGFRDAEMTLLKSYDFVTPISLGPQILRAETASVMALSCWVGKYL